MGGTQTATRRGGRRNTASHGDVCGKRGRKSRGIARKRWQFIPLLTAPPGLGGGTLGELWKFAMGSPAKGKGEVLSRYLLHKPTPSYDGRNPRSSSQAPRGRAWRIRPPPLPRYAQWCGYFGRRQGGYRA